MKTSRALFLLFGHRTFPNILLSILDMFFTSINLSIAMRAIHSEAEDVTGNVNVFDCLM